MGKCRVAGPSEFQTLLVWRVVRRLASLRLIRRVARCFKPCWCGEWFGGKNVVATFAIPNKVSNLVGVESGSEVDGQPMWTKPFTEFQTLLVWRVVRRTLSFSSWARHFFSFKPCWCGEWFGGAEEVRRMATASRVSNLVGVESGSEGLAYSVNSNGIPRFQTLLVWRVVRRGPWRRAWRWRKGSFKPCWCGEWFGGSIVGDDIGIEIEFQTLLVWRVVRRFASVVSFSSACLSFKPCWCGEWFGGASLL